MTVRILSYNIQAAISTQAYRQYVTHIRRQLFNTRSKNKTLKAIANFASDYDVACFQEVDLGGRRSGYKNQAESLLKLSKFGHISAQENRVVGNISKHGNAVLSKHRQSATQDLKLPGSRTGRGAILTKIEAEKPFYILNVHLSLGEDDQKNQVQFLAESAPKGTPLIVAGDFNCRSTSLPVRALAEALDLTVLTTPNLKTYPSWSPRRDLDHILISSHFLRETISVDDVRYSDHRPVSATLKI